MRRFLIVLGLLTVLLFIPQTLSVTGQTPVYLSRGNIFSQYFTEPVETLIFIAVTGDFYAVTNFDERSVAINYDELKKRLLKDGYEIKDLMCVIHNHVGTLMKFSPRDLQFYGILKSDGFGGLFLLWSSTRQRVTDMRYQVDLYEVGKDKILRVPMKNTQSLKEFETHE